MKDTGILLIAIGTTDYGHMAWNMAKSIKSQSPNVKISVITEGHTFNHFTTEQLNIFDQVIKPMPVQYMDRGVLNAYKLKTYLYDLTPYKKTLYIDCDGMFSSSRTIEDLIKEIGRETFLIYEVARFTKENAHTSETVWTGGKKDQRLSQVWDQYGISESNDYPEYNSSFIWFTKNKANEKYFEAVKGYYIDRVPNYTRIGKHYPDELAFGVASAKLKHYNKSPEKKFMFFEWYKNMTDPSQINDYFFSMAGGYTSQKLVNYYNARVRAHGDKWVFNNVMKFYHVK